GGGGGNPPSNPDSLFNLPIVNAMPGDNICLPVTVSGFDNIVSFQYSINFDPSVLEFQMVTNFGLPGMTANNFNASGGDITVSWFDPAATGVTLPDDSTVFELCFLVVGNDGQSTDLVFSDNPTPIEVVDGNFNMIPFSGLDGLVNVCNDLNNCGGGTGGGGGGGGPTCPGGMAFMVDEVTAGPNEQVCVDFMGCQFVDIVSFQFTITFDPAELQFDNLGDLNLPGLTSTSFNTDNANSQGFITVSWLDPNVAGISLPDGDPIFSLCFTAIGSEGTFADIAITNSPTDIEVSDPNGLVDPVNIVNGGVNIQTVVCNPLNLVDAQVTDVACNGEASGAVDITVEGGTGTYQFSWKNAAGTEVSTSEDLTNAPAGTYSLTVSSCNGNEVLTESYTITEPASALSSTQSISHVACNGESTGAILTATFGGTPPYQYSWSGPVNNPNSPNQTNIPAGTYAYTVTDSKGCQLQSGNLEVNEPDQALNGSANITDAACFGEASGAIQFQASGGTPPYTYSIGAGFSSNNTFSNLEAGNYTGFIQDQNGCTFTLAGLQVGSPPEIVFNAFDITSETNGCDGAITIQVGGGASSTYTYQWTGPNGPMGGSTSLSGLCSGEYCVTVTEVTTNCQVTRCAFVAQPMSLGASVKHACFDTCDAIIDLQIQGGLGPFTFDWSDDNIPTTTEDPSGLCPGVYSVTVTSQDGQSTSLTNISVGQASSPVMVSSIDIQQPTGPNVCNATATATGSGGFGPPFSYLWSNQATGQTTGGLCVGTHSVTVFDSNGCPASETFEVEFNPQ
ncbi:MAG: hypothetical protein D6765_08125, partial [Bacteroidetes bacterium]